MRRIGDSVTMWVTVNYLRRDISCRTQTRVTLSRKEWDPLIELIVQQDLLTWKPDSASQGFTEEGGITGFALTGAGEARNQQSWIGLIENRTAPKALADALNQLAKEKVRRLHSTTSIPSEPLGCRREESFGHLFALCSRQLTGE